MTLSTFIKNSLDELSGLDGGVVEFDIAVYPDGNSGINVDMTGSPGLSRIKFGVKLKPSTQTNPEAKEKI